MNLDSIRQLKDLIGMDRLESYSTGCINEFSGGKDGINNKNNAILFYIFVPFENHSERR
jgi:hypothetical protein